jgi:single-stranded-DNA-specific exonuclease
MAETIRRNSAVRRWIFPESAVPERQAAELARTLRISPVLARLLLRRGFDTPDAADAFLTRNLMQLNDPATLPDIDAAVKRVQRAVEKGERILLFGDYDADGLTATALMGRFFRTLKEFTRGNFTVECRVPQRAHGYGLSPESVALLLEWKPDLLITLDNGISAHDALDAFAQRGIDCIVVDHHHVGETLPRAVAVVNPKRRDSAYPFDDLCGAGIAFKFAWALAVAFSKSRKAAPELRHFLLDALALAGIGTIADVVPLVRENRVIAHQSLVALGRSQWPGLKALLRNAAVEGLPRCSDVGFRIGPRLNAAGRCGDVAEALELLLTDDAARADALAAKMEQYNTERQGIEQAILEDARRQALLALQADAGLAGLVLSSDGWHPGVIGIVASRIVEEFYRPTLMLSVDGASGLARGSGRSISGFHLAEALANSATLLLTHGGHAAAAGLSLNAANIDAFRSGFAAHARGNLSDEQMVPRLMLDEEVRLSELNGALCEELERFEPCGMGNPRPLFAARGVMLAGKPTLMGRDESHVSFFGRQQSASLRCIGFRFADQFNALVDLSKAPLDLAFRPQINTFRGNSSVELVLEAFRG